MGNIISTELLKIKRYSVVKAGLVMIDVYKRQGIPI